MKAFTHPRTRPSWRSPFWLCALALTISVQPSLAAPSTGAQLQKMRSVYAKQLKAIDAALEKELKGHQQRLITKMQALEKKIQDSGKLDPLLIARKERARFTRQRVIRKEHLVPAVSGLFALQTEYMKQLDDQPREKARRILVLASQYDKSLGRLQTLMTRKGKIEEALAAKKDRAAQTHRRCR